MADDENIQSGLLLSADVEYAVLVLDKTVTMHTQWLLSLHEAIISAFHFKRRNDFADTLCIAALLQND